MVDEGANRRIADRYALTAEIDLESEHNFYTGFTENISSGGLFVATHDLLDLGTTLEIRFTLPTSDRIIVAACEVRWQRLEQPNNPDFSPGIGIRFTQLEDQDRAAIDAFIKKRDTLFFDDE